MRALAALLPESSGLTIEPFGAVVGRFVTLCGGRLIPLAQSGHVRAALAEACFALPEESIFFDSSRFSGTHKKIGNALDELRGWGVDADDLEQLSERIEGAFGNKLKSLAFIEREVSESLRKIGRERVSDRLAGSIELEPESTDFGRLLIVAGSELEPIQMRWLREAAAKAFEITLVLDKSASDNGLFRRTWAISNMRFARSGSPENAKEALPIEETRESAPNRLLQNLFSDSQAKGRDIDVRIVSTADPLAEAEWAVRGVLQDLEKGAHPDDVAIYSRDPDTYVPLVESAALRLGLRLSASRRVPLLANSFARLIVEVIEFCASDDVRLIACLLRSSYLVLDAEVRRQLHEASKGAYRAGQNQWEVLEQFAREGGEPLAWLRELLDWRRTCLGQPEKLSVWSDRLRELGHQPWHEAALEGATPTSTRDGYGQNALQRTLAQYASIEQAISGRKYTLQHFARFAKRLWENAEVSLPSIPGAVRLVSSTAELGSISSLYVLGMLEGVFPRRRSEDPILTDDDRAAISERLALPFPLLDSHAKAFAEREEFYRICGAAGNKLVLSYPQTEDERDNVPAFYLSEVERAMSGEVQKINHRRTELVPPDDPQAEADERLARALNAPTEKPLANTLLTPDATEIVSRGASHPVSVSELADVLECPFRYLAESTLDLAPNRRRSRWHHLYALPGQTGLATSPTPEQAEQALEDRLKSETDRLFAETATHDLALIRSGGNRLVGEWIEREFASRSLWARGAVIDTPSFERGDLRSKLKGDGGFIYLKGEYPALSMRDGYRVLHLFRASEPWDESGIREDEPWYRLKKRHQFEIGLLFLALGDPGSRVGVDIDSASGARNLFLSPRAEQQFRSDQLKGFRVTVIDVDRMKDIGRDVMKLVKQATNRIRTASVDPTPGEHCRTCEFGELCRRSMEFGEEVDPFEQDEFDA